MEIIVTRHAYERMKERAGLNKSAASRIAVTAYENGICHEDVSGSLYNYISGKCLAYMKQGQIIRIYGEFVYCFSKKENDLFLVTVYGIPKRLRNSSNSKQKKKKESERG